MLNHMVEQTHNRLDAVFQALGDATRRQMLGALMAGEQSITQLAAPFAMSLAAASKHVRVLEGAGLIRRKVRGRSHLCRLDPGPLAGAHHWLAAYERFWSGRVETLERRLREDHARDRSRPRRQSPDGDEP